MELGSQSVFMGSGYMAKMAIMSIYGKKDLKFFILVVHEWLLLELTKNQNSWIG